MMSLFFKKVIASPPANDIWSKIKRDGHYNRIPFYSRKEDKFIFNVDHPNFYFL